MGRSEFLSRCLRRSLVLSSLLLFPSGLVLSLSLPLRLFVQCYPHERKGGEEGRRGWKERDAGWLQARLAGSPSILFQLANLPNCSSSSKQDGGKEREGDLQLIL